MRHNHIKHESVTHHSPEEKKWYYWIFAVDNITGEGLVFGKKSSQAEAEAAAGNIHNAEVEIIPLQTSDEAKASQAFRAKRLMTTGNVAETSRRFNHKNRL